MKPRRATVTMLAPALVATLMASACTSKPGDVTPSSAPASPGAANVLARVASATRAAGTAKVAIDISLRGSSSAGAGTSFSEHGNGVFDFAHHRGTLTMTFRTPTSPGASVSIHVIVDRSVIYEKLPPGLLGEQAPKPWIRIDLSGTALGSLAQGDPSTSDPTQALSLLAGSTGAVSDLGEGRVRGVACRHYRTTVDLSKVTANLPAEARTEFAAYQQTFVSKAFPADVWVDADGRLRKVSFTARLTPSAIGATSGPAPSITETIEYFDFGSAVTVVPPPASQVTDLSGLLATPSP